MTTKYDKRILRNLLLITLVKQITFTNSIAVVESVVAAMIII